MASDAARIPPDAVFAADGQCVMKKHGLGVFATAHIPAGTLLLLERPFVLTPSFEGRRSTCALCFAQAHTTGSHEWAIRCERCDCVAFCSERCARAKTTLHNDFECGALARWTKHAPPPSSCAGKDVKDGVPNDDDDDDEEEDDEDDEDDDDDDDDDIADLIFQAIRILSYRATGRESHPFCDSPAQSAQELAVTYESYASRLVPMKRSKRTASAIQRAVRSALRVMPRGPARVPPAELYDILNRHQCNLVGVLGPGGTSVGLASFLGALHLYNHSCMPNAGFDSRSTGGGLSGAVTDSVDGALSASHVSPIAEPAAFEFAAFGFRALVDINAGDEICHCYAGSADGPSQRLQYLRDHHGFTCVCRRCACDDIVEETELSEQLDAIRCGCEGCYTGLSYPLLTNAAGDAAAELYTPSSDGDVLRQCVLCGGRFYVED